MDEPSPPEGEIQAGGSQAGEPPHEHPGAPGFGARLQEGRQTFQPALWLRLIVFGLVLLYLILFVVLNTRGVKVSFVFTSTRVALVWVIVVAGLGGIVLGVLASQVHRFRRRRRR